MEKGNLSVDSTNILPIIKKWLYSDSDIFLRELVSNSSDAITKLKRLDMMGKAKIATDEKFRIDVFLDKTNRTIKIIDNGLGMTDEEIKKYINQIAFSGAEDFVKKYEDKSDDIIGHFGLGFYSSFMVADFVEIDSLSYQEGAKPAYWKCEGGIEYEMSEGNRDSRGTTITLHLSDDRDEFLEEFRLREILKKYCAFMPIEIYFVNEVVKDGETVKEEKDEEKKDDEKEEEIVESPINNTHPLWLKDSKDISDEEYISFYHEVFMDFSDPLFWIHLNMDYPIRLKGILYFPKLKNEMNSYEGEVKLYNNQVFVADNLKEVIPEFLLLLKGCLDCPDLPLNVSRSFLQSDGYADKMSSYISRKVGDKLSELFKDERENFEKFWDDISLFVKFGSMRESKFYEKVKDIIIYKNLDDKYISIEKYIEESKGQHEDKIFYVSDLVQQSQYINLFKAEGLDALLLDSNIDPAFISFLETQIENNRFCRIDADLSESLLDENVNKNEELEELFKKVLGKENLKIESQSLKSKDVASLMLLSEEGRRFEEMKKLYGDLPFPMDESHESLVINTNNDLVQKLIENLDDDKNAEVNKMIVEQLYDLALMSHTTLDADSMTKFMKRTNEIMKKLYI